MDCGIPHLLLDVRPKVEVDICHLPVSISMISKSFLEIQILFGTIDTIERAIEWHKHDTIKIVFFFLLIDIPLASLEDQKGDHIHFLKEKINELKLQMSSDLEVPGNWQNFHSICNFLYTLYSME